MRLIAVSFSYYLATISFVAYFCNKVIYSFAVFLLHLFSKATCQHTGLHLNQLDVQLINVHFFMAKPKYSLETSNHYLAGHNGARRIAERFGVEETSVRRWVRARQLNGIDGIILKNDRHSPEFRLTVVQRGLSEELTMREDAARFNISNESVVRHWVKIYKNTGEEGLLNIKPGRSKDMTKPQKHLHLPMQNWKSYLPKNCGLNSVTFAQKMPI